ncbi:hypothetical protein BYT27DRAFT_6563089 [Phlegmacium glaucopus]|nr:hypothetical protein BYT27DRAFT_6563089 [Phlegmacium glaucopus]
MGCVTFLPQECLFLTAGIINDTEIAEHGHEWRFIILRSACVFIEMTNTLVLLSSGHSILLNIYQYDPTEVESNLFFKQMSFIKCEATSRKFRVCHSILIDTCQVDPVKAEAHICGKERIVPPSQVPTHGTS